MPVDLLNIDNYMNYNIRVAQVLGLHPAIYIQLLFSIWQKAERKKSLIDNSYIKVDREYITFMTTFSEEEQLKLDGVLSKLGIVSKPKDEKDLIKLDMSLYTTIVSSTDKVFIDKIKSKLEIKDTRESKEIKKQDKSDRIRECLKRAITSKNTELANALMKWIDSIMDKPSGENYITKEQVKLFQYKLSEYTKGDVKLSLVLVGIASEHGYKYFDYVKNMYESGKKKKETLRVTKQERVVSRDKLSREVY